MLRADNRVATLQFLASLFGLAPTPTPQQALQRLLGYSSQQPSFFHLLLEMFHLLHPQPAGDATATHPSLAPNHPSALLMQVASAQCAATLPT